MHLFVSLVRCIQLQRLHQSVNTSNSDSLQFSHLTSPLFFLLLTPSSTTQAHKNKHCLNSNSSFLFPWLLLSDNASISASFCLRRGISVGQVPCHGVWLYNACFVWLCVRVFVSASPATLTSQTDNRLNFDEPLQSLGAVR